MDESHTLRVAARIQDKGETGHSQGHFNANNRLAAEKMTSEFKYQKKPLKRQSSGYRVSLNSLQKFKY